MTKDQSKREILRARRRKTTMSLFRKVTMTRRKSLEVMADIMLLHPYPGIQLDCAHSWRLIQLFVHFWKVAGKCVRSVQMVLGAYFQPFSKGSFFSCRKRLVQKYLCVLVRRSARLVAIEYISAWFLSSVCLYIQVPVFLLLSSGSSVAFWLCALLSAYQSLSVSICYSLYITVCLSALYGRCRCRCCWMVACLLSASSFAQQVYHCFTVTCNLDPLCLRYLASQKNIWFFLHHKPCRFHDFDFPFIIFYYLFFTPFIKCGDTLSMSALDNAISTSMVVFLVQRVA